MDIPGKMRVYVGVHIQVEIPAKKDTRKRYPQNGQATMKANNKLSAKDVENAKPKEKAYKLADGEGLYLFCTPAGGKLWRMSYRVDGKEKTLCLGAYPDISLKNAREARAEKRKMIAQGIDPMIEKKRVKQEEKRRQREESMTFAVVAREWFSQKMPDRKELYRQQTITRLENHVFPYIGNIPITNLEPSQILAGLRVTEGRGSVDMAHRLARLIRQVCKYAVAAGYAKFNAASDLSEALKKRPPVKPRAAITNPREIGVLLRAIDDYPGDISTRYALKIMPYVFVRSQELRGARWDEIDFATAIWTIPADRMKMKKEHIVPLAPQVLRLFEELREWSGHVNLCFPSPHSSSKNISDMCLLNALRRMGYEKESMCIHGFRAMASTLLNDSGKYRSEVIEAQLAHSEKNNSRRPYNRAEYLQERKKMLKEWADYLDRLREESPD